MNAPNTKLKAAWRRHLIRNISNGKTLTEACRVLRIGRSKLHAEFRRDGDFKTEVEQILGHEVDSIV
ncbi:MAG TPA: hypothetical protein VKA19_06305 [Alphaproteobacteria bacterium]|nr:hypothetical protein [Alphaproteobacteria bacterium]